MSDGSFWRLKKEQKAHRDTEIQMERARTLLTQALDLLGGPDPSALGTKPPPGILSLEAEAFFRAPPPVVGYMNCEGCKRHRRCFLIGEQKLCITCRKALPKVDTVK